MFFANWWFRPTSVKNDVLWKMSLLDVAPLKHLRTNSEQSKFYVRQLFRAYYRGNQLHESFSTLSA